MASLTSSCHWALRWGECYRGHQAARKSLAQPNAHLNQDPCQTKCAGFLDGSSHMTSWSLCASANTLRLVHPFPARHSEPGSWKYEWLAVSRTHFTCISVPDLGDLGITDSLHLESDAFPVSSFWYGGKPTVGICEANKQAQRPPLCLLPAASVAPTLLSPGRCRWYVTHVETKIKPTEPGVSTWHVSRLWEPCGHRAEAGQAPSSLLGKEHVAVQWRRLARCGGGQNIPLCPEEPRETSLRNWSEFCLFFLEVPGFELRVSRLIGRYFTIWAALPTLFVLGIFK
jgi:hypothetical protein